MEELIMEHSPVIDEEPSPHTRYCSFKALKNGGTSFHFLVKLASGVAMLIRSSTHRPG